MVSSGVGGAYEVLLATCNGAEHLDQQLASILAQTRPPQRLLVADDASSDGTAQLLEAWQRRSAVPIELLQPLPQRQGSCASFERLLTASRAAYVMPADQDDLWDVDKAERLLAAMVALERRWGSEQPLLVHGDLRLIDATGEALAPSFHRHQGLRPQRTGWLEVALQNVVTGCACLVNRACVQQALPFPPEAVLHDWWLALVAARLGCIGYVAEPCVSYRQHGSNLVGAAGWRRQLRRRLREGLVANTGQEAAEQWLGPGLRQLRACQQRYGDGLSLRQRRCFDALYGRACWSRLAAALALGLRKHGPWRTLGFYGALLRWQPQQS